MVAKQEKIAISKRKPLFIAYAIHVFGKHIRGLAEQKD
jgi:hypothetical protein